MLSLKYLVALVILLGIPVCAHAATSSTAQIARDYTPGILAFSALLLRIRFLVRPRRHR